RFRLSDAPAIPAPAANATGADISPAHEVTLIDTLPAGLINLRNVSVSPNALCIGLATADNSVGDTLDLFFTVLEPGCVVSVSFDADLDGAVAPGLVVTNIASSTWTSLPGAGGTASNPTGSTTPGASGDADGERDGSGGVNDFSATGSAGVTIPGVGLTKAVIATSELDTGTGEFRPTIDDLAVGESTTFEIAATLPEGTTPQLVIQDTLPFANGVMRLDSASIVSLGANLTADNPAPPAMISDAQLSDGINDTVSFDFGQVINAADGVVNADDQVLIRVDATLVDQPTNTNGFALTNTALVQFGPGLNASASAGVDVVEPILNIDKSGGITQGDAGDPVTFVITINHLPASSADAHDLVFQDVLPAGLVLNPASISVTSGPNFDVNSSAGNTVALGWAGLIQTDTIVLEYQATLASDVMPGQTVTNTGDLSWTSIAGANPDERTRDDSDAHAIVVTAPGLDKIVFATSEPSTGSAEFGAPVDATIGEQITWRFTIAFPEGLSEAAVVTDQLPTGSSVMQVVSSRLVRRGANLSGPGLPAVGDPGVASDSDADTVDDRVVWTLGNVANAADGLMNADDEMEFEVVAVVLDVAANQSADVDQLNVATLQTTGSTVSGTAPIDLVEPALALDKSIVTPMDGFVDAGDTVVARLVISHTAASTADAFNLVVTDTLPAGVTWAGDGLVSSDCPGLNTDSSGQPDIVFDLAGLDLTTSSCFIDYQVTVDLAAMPGQTLTNSAVLDYDSTPVFVAGETRRRMDSATAEVSVIGPALVKLAVDSNLPDTGQAQGDPGLLDLTIGETVTYRLTAVFPEGTSNNVLLIDRLPAAAGGVIEAIGAAVTVIG
ncbi:MAG: isopeptide-forming domain-containing fimbrial protein, partial [Wenzhouxiangellaceae bacterium]